jgi:selenocysteine-specific elongation factor
VRFHIGTAEVMASIRLLDQEDLSPGESGLAQIYLNEPIVAIWNQPFVIRRESPVFTIGGGRILDPNAEKIRDPNGVDFEMLRQLARADELERSAAAAYWHCSDGWDPYTLPRTVGVFAIESTLQPLLDSGEVIKLRLSASRDFLVHRLRLQQFSERVLAVLEKLHMEFPLRFTHVKSDLEARFAWLENKVLLQAAIRHLKDENKIVLNENSIGLVGAGPKISKGEQQLMDHLTKTILEAGLQPPTVQELQKSITKNKDSLEEVLRLAGENGVLVQVSREFHFHRSVIDEVCRRLKSEIFKTGGLTVSEIRQLLNISRKYAIPLCEYLDSINFLSRDGDTRRLGESAL